MNNHFNFGFYHLDQCDPFDYLSNGTSNQVAPKNDIFGQDAQWCIMKWDMCQVEQTKMTYMVKMTNGFLVT